VFRNTSRRTSTFYPLILLIAWAVLGVAITSAQTDIVRFDITQDDGSTTADLTVDLCSTFNVQYRAVSLVDDSNDDASIDDADRPATAYADILFNAGVISATGLNFQPIWSGEAGTGGPNGDPASAVKDDYFNDQANGGLFNDVGSSFGGLVFVDNSNFSLNGDAYIAQLSFEAVAIGSTSIQTELADELSSETVTFEAVGGQDVSRAVLPSRNTNTEQSAVFNGLNIIVDAVPTLNSIARGNPATTPTNATTVTFRVTFSEAVSGVTQSDFALVAQGFNTAPTITSVTGVDGSTSQAWDVTVEIGTDATLQGATLGLQMNTDGSIQNADNQTFVIVNTLDAEALYAELPDNPPSDAADPTTPRSGDITKQCETVSVSPFPAGPDDPDPAAQDYTLETYTIDQKPPAITTFTTTGPIDEATFTFLLTFDEPVTGLALDDFSLSAATTGDVSIDSLQQNPDLTDGSSYIVQIDTSTLSSGGDRTETITLELDPDAVTDGASNRAPDALTTAEGIWTNEGVPDLVGTNISMTRHALRGLVNVDFTIRNDGTAPTTGFDVELILADTDACIADASAEVLDTIAVSGIAAQTNEVINLTNVQLPKATLYSRAIVEDPPGQGTSYVSQNRDFLCLNIDSGNAISEVSENNNNGQGAGVDYQDFAYFPFDTDQSSPGQVTIFDVRLPLNYFNQFVPAAPADIAPENFELNVSDVDGNGQVTIFDVRAIVDRFLYSLSAPYAGDAIVPATPSSANAIAGLPIGTRDLAEFEMRVVELDRTPGLVVGEAFNVEIYLRSTNNVAVFGGFGDVSYDTARLDVGGVRYGMDYGLLQNASINEASGNIKRLGAVTSATAPDQISSNLLAIIRMTATQSGTATINIESNRSIGGGIALYDSTPDISAYTQGASVSVTISDLTAPTALPALPVPAANRGGSSGTQGMQPVAPQPTPTPLPALPVPEGR
jgi:hypothetical protein